jgi:hypothetical protein
MKVDVADIQKMDLKPGQVLVISMDLGRMPPMRKRDQMTAMLKTMRSVIPDKSIHIVAIPSTTTFSIHDLPNIPQLEPEPFDPIEAWNRAKGVVCP